MYGSESSSDGGWISWFIELEGHEFFVEVSVRIDAEWAYLRNWRLICLLMLCETGRRRIYPRLVQPVWSQRARSSQVQVSALFMDLLDSNDAAKLLTYLKSVAAKSKQSFRIKQKRRHFLDCLKLLSLIFKANVAVKMAINHSLTLSWSVWILQWSPQHDLIQWESRLRRLKRLEVSRFLVYKLLALVNQVCPTDLNTLPSLCRSNSNDYRDLLCLSFQTLAFWRYTRPQWTSTD